MTDPYCYPNYRILKNKLGVKDYDRLHDRKRDLSNLRAIELLNNPISDRFNRDNNASKILSYIPKKYHLTKIREFYRRYAR